MKNIHYYLSLSTGLVLFVITPVQHGLGMGTETTAAQEEQPEATTKAADSSDTKQSRKTHHCPFCDCEYCDEGYSLSTENDPFEDDPFFESIEKSMQQAFAHAAQSFAAVNKQVKTFKGQKDITQYSIQEITPTDNNQYGVKITLPGYEQKDLSVTVKTTQRKFSDSKNTVHITAKKSPEPSTKTETTKDADDKEKPVVKHFSTNRFTSISYINGQGQEVTYEDGKLTINFDLPAGINVDANNYSMTFENGILTLTFQKLPNETSLKFKDHCKGKETTDK